jgi:hypothetical protein
MSDSAQAKVYVLVEMVYPRANFCLGFLLGIRELLDLKKYCQFCK